MPFLHYACDAVFVSQDSPDQNDSFSPVVCVGFSEHRLSKPMAHAAYGQYIGLIQFPPLILPEHQKVVSVRLCMLVCSPCSHDVWVGVYQNAAPFDAGTVTYRTRPAAAPFPIASVNVTPRNRLNYVTCDMTAFMKDRQGMLPGLGFSLMAAGHRPGVAAFYAQAREYMPYLEITCGQDAEQPGSPGSGFLENVFRERVFELRGMERALYSPSLNTAGVRTITFFVRNEGDHPLDFHLQFSPDGMVFLDDKQSFRLEAGEMKAAAPYLFGKFMRVCLNPVQDSQYTAARVWCQAQTNNYMVKGSFQEADSPKEGGAFAM